MSEATIIHHIATKLQIRPNQIQAALDLFADGNTIPFVARYRNCLLYTSPSPRDS